MKNGFLNRQLEMGNRQWEMGNWQLAIVNRQLAKSKSIITNCILLIAYCIFHIAYRIFHISHSSLRIAYCSLLIAYCLFLPTQNVNAQTPITLKQAMDTALQNNLSIKNERLKTEYQQKLIATGKSIPATQIFTEYGQINSVYPDVKIGVAQSISFPKVYTAQKSLLNEEWKSSVLKVGVQEAVLKKQVTETFYTLVYLQQKKNLLQKNDSLFKAFLEKAQLRFQKGESNILEKATAENQRGQIALQLAQIENDREIVQLQFQLLLNSETKFSPAADERHFEIYNVNSDFLANHPNLQYWKQQQNIAAVATKTEQSKLLPDLNFGYNLMGMKGINANSKDYNSLPRFQSVQVGLGIPIFTSGQKAKINAAKINEQVAANEIEAQKKNLETAFQTVFAQYHKYRKSLEYYENTALKNAAIITSTAQKQFLNGEINYLEWVILTNQSIAIQSDYIEVVNHLNTAIAALNYFLNH